MIDAQQVKAESERLIIDAGGRICDWLPHLEPRTTRESSEIIGRALVLNAMLQIAFNAPVNVIRRWINDHDVADHLTASEQAILQKDSASLTAEDQIDLYWSIEALWALMWVGKLIDDIPFTQPVRDDMADLCPRLQDNQNGDRFIKRMQIRPYEELFPMLDLYFRLHWWTRDAELSDGDTSHVSLDIIMERRKSLEWVLNPSLDWDHIELNT